ncbi:tetratricopeptide repeat protein [Candidatus Dependentiae bacterium]|nr:tetratricopeptide repeat protein [Candidatus Dependentiae bacterium]
MKLKLIFLFLYINIYSHYLISNNSNSQTNDSWFTKAIKSIKKQIQWDQNQKNNTYEDNGFELIWADKNLHPSAKNYFLYLKSTYQHLNGQLLKSLQSFEKLFSMEKPKYAHEGFIRLLYDLNQFEKINKLDKNIKEYFDDNLDIQLIFAESLLNLNQDEQAERLYKKLAQKYPDNEKIAYYSAVSYLKNNKLDKALNFIKSCLNRPSLKSKHFLFHFLASKVHLYKKDIYNAMISIKKSLQLYPEFEKGWLLKALLEEQQGRINEAISGYKKFLDITGEDTAVEKQLIQLLFNSGRFKEAGDILQKMEIDTPEYYCDLALIKWKSNEYKSALENVNKAIEKFPNFIKAKLLKIEILISQNNKKKALQFVQNWLKENPSSLSVIRILIMLRKGGVETTTIINTLEEILSKNQNNKTILAVLADLYLEEKNFDAVLNYCNKLLEKTQDPILQSKLLFQMSYVAFMKGEGDQLEKYLNQAFEKNIIYPSSYNLLAYHYAQNNKKLHEAIRLINIALKKEPKNYYFLDTKGYIYLKMGKIKEAISLFKQAISFAENDEIIQNHLNIAQSLENKPHHQISAKKN